MELAVKILMLGVFATLAIDIWATFSNRVLNLPRTDWAIVGRWLGHIPKGVISHESIRSAVKVKHENIVGWLFHYVVGVIYAAVYISLFVLFWGNAPTLVSAWAFGLATIVSPWFIMQPSLGLGICAIKASRPNMVRLQNISIHSIFGVALYYGWLSVNILHIPA